MWTFWSAGMSINNCFVVWIKRYSGRTACNGNQLRLLARKNSLCLGDNVL